MQNEKVKLPIDSYLLQILEAVRNYSTIVVKATPGSGKTTRLPWAVASCLGKKVAVLEPRRLAAKLAAFRIAEEQGLTLGKEVGYHFRFEKTLSPETRLAFYTEGTFLKLFLSDPNLTGVDVIILDEFHERHLDTDLALAFLRALQIKRKEIKLIIMSATLNEELLLTLPDSTFVSVEGTLHPIDVSYLPNQPSILNQTLESKVRKAVEETSGDTLVFLPGMREMLRVKEVLAEQKYVFLLHAELSREEQSLALRPTEGRKIILATNIAESSVTIPGIVTVIDSGIQRESIFSPWTGLRSLQDKKITQASAIQRAGRAGRTGPGVCRRLYAEQDFRERDPDTRPEIERSDLTDVCLLVQGASLTPLWLERPPEEKWKKAQELLVRLGALSDAPTITPIGEKLLNYPLEARLARVLLQGESLKSELKRKLLHYITFEIENDKAGNLLRRLSSYLQRQGDRTDDWEKCLLAGFIDQLGKFRPKQRDFIHYSGKILKAHPTLQNLEEGHYIIFDITQRDEAIKVLAIHEDWLWELDPFPFTEETETVVAEKIQLIRKTRLGSIPVEESIVRVQWGSLTESEKRQVARDAQGIIRRKISSWRETPEGKRLAFWSRLEQKNLEAALEAVEPFNYFEEVQDLSFEHFDWYLKKLLEEKLSPGDLSELLPDKINLGGRKDLTIHYSLEQGAYLEAPIQEFYGITETPAIMKGKIPLTLMLLGPHKRPIQITKDLNSFWHKAYQEMKKEYSRDYPRHYWPDKPWEAKPYLLKSHLPKA